MQQSPQLRRPNGAQSEQNGADRQKNDAGWYDVFRAEAVQRRSGDKRKRRIGVIVEAEQRVMPSALRPKVAVSSGIITLGAERNAYCAK